MKAMLRQTPPYTQKTSIVGIDRNCNIFFGIVWKNDYFTWKCMLSIPASSHHYLPHKSTIINKQAPSKVIIKTNTRLLTSHRNMSLKDILEGDLDPLPYFATWTTHVDRQCPPLPHYPPQQCRGSAALFPHIESRDLNINAWALFKSSPLLVWNKAKRRWHSGKCKKAGKKAHYKCYASFALPTDMGILNPCHNLIYTAASMDLSLTSLNAGLIYGLRSSP